MPFARCGLFLLAASLLLSAHSTRAVEFKLEEIPDGVRVLWDGQPFTEYLTTKGPKPILWPIIGPTGLPMTRAYPLDLKSKGERKDHHHHKSLWFTHGNVDGIDFWSEGRGKGTIKHIAFDTVTGGESGHIVARSQWLDADGKLHLLDLRDITFRARGDQRVIDFNITLTATDQPATFGDTKEGSFGVRIPTVLDVDSRKGGTIVTSEGLTDAAAWGKPASWVDYHGPLAGQTLGIAILNHPSSFRYPTHWHVRTYGLFAANPFGLRDFQGNDQVDGSHTLAAGQSLTLRYRVIFHTGDHLEAKLAEAFAEYAAQP